MERRDLTGVHGMQGGEAVKTLKGLLRSCGLVQSASRGHHPRRHSSFIDGTKVCGIWTTFQAHNSKWESVSHTGQSAAWVAPPACMLNASVR